ncbi:Arm DNA-binding domain-containing protein [Erythrobacter sp.]|uniref:Arm DNA-binding domain-containing protein n=1 Tax=Erythrobacter sp. TaxID=1042 RepID=UPI002ECECA4C|nr:Arm DNA-binding domain-containing protein [Erythrobacter sp.]
MALLELQIKKAQPKERPYKLSDGEGLFLLVKPSGSKLWRLKNRFAGKEKLVSFGLYPEVGISAARELRTIAKGALAEGKDPMIAAAR